MKAFSALMADNMRSLALCALVLLYSSAGSNAGPTEWPNLTESAARSECAQALEIGKAVFRSHAAELYALTGIPPLVGSKLVLGPKEIDISGGDELRADTDVFAKLPINGASPPRHLYWQKTATNGVHWAVAERAMGWHGDMYSLFAVPHGRNPDALFAKYFGTETADGLKPLIDDNWRPPLMIQDTSGAVWAIDVGEPFIPLGSWDVYVADSGRARQACTIAFRPDVRDITTLLPAPVRRLASLLDQTIGPGTNEGTLHPTAQLRIDVAHTWANVALRPWAVSHQPYNTRHDVDVALKTWAGRAPGFAAVYHSIEAQYPAAQRALGVYYRMHFHKPQKAAKQSAAYALGIAFRSYFVFHREGSQASPTPVSANPWR